MRDVLVVAMTVGFFALCVAYVTLCDRIIGPDEVDADPAHADPAHADPAEAETETEAAAP